MVSRDLARDAAGTRVGGLHAFQQELGLAAQKGGLQQLGGGLCMLDGDTMHSLSHFSRVSGNPGISKAVRVALGGVSSCH